LKANKEYKLDLTKPVGITYMSVNSVTVTINLGTVSERDITGVRVVTRNLQSGYSVSATSESSATVTVNLKGVASVIDNITSDDIVAYVDLSGLGAGTHDVEVAIEGSDSKVEYLSKTKKVTLTISKQ
jgi:YbbR domain-containing protein